MEPDRAEELASEWGKHHASWQEREELARAQGKRERWLPFMCRVGLHRWRGQASGWLSDEGKPKSFQCERCLRVHGKYRGRG